MEWTAVGICAAVADSSSTGRTSITFNWPVCSHYDLYELYTAIAIRTRSIGFSFLFVRIIYSCGSDAVTLACGPLRCLFFFFSSWSFIGLLAVLALLRMGLYRINWYDIFGIFFFLKNILTRWFNDDFFFFFRDGWYTTKKSLSVWKLAFRMFILSTRPLRHHRRINIAATIYFQWI